jgi:hypothetical protein
LCEISFQACKGISPRKSSIGKDNAFRGGCLSGFGGIALAGYGFGLRTLIGEKSPWLSKFLRDRRNLL